MTGVVDVVLVVRRRARLYAPWAEFWWTNLVYGRIEQHRWGCRDVRSTKVKHVWIPMRRALWV